MFTWQPDSEGGVHEPLLSQTNISGMESPIKKQVMEVWIGSQMIICSLSFTPYAPNGTGTFTYTFTTNVSQIFP